MALGVARTRALGTIARHYGQRSTDQAILAELARAGRQTNGALTRGLGMSTGGVTPAVDRLEERGLVRRLPHPDDRRSSMLDLTEEGTRMMRAGGSIITDALAPLEARLTEAEVALVLQVLERAVQGYAAAADHLTSPDGEYLEWRKDAS